MHSIDQKHINQGASKYMIRALIAPLFMCILYFLAAGNLNNTRAWIYYILFFVLAVGVNSILYIHNKELLYHRSKSKPDAVGWDKWLMPIAVVTGFHLQSLVMGFEARFAVPCINNTALVLGLLLYLLSYFFTTWSMLINHHFEANVRIQKDRDHTVISTGPYSIVRHPGYLAFILATFSIPLIVGSYYGFINAFLGSILILIRTYKEDNTLKKELEGYQDYTSLTRFRILPGIW